MTGSFALLKQRRFLPLFVTQLLGAFNDNLFKNAMVLFVVYGVFNDEASETLFSAVATGLFILPFFLFSALAGQLADSTDKTRMIRIVKFCEILIMIVGGAGLVLAWLGFAVHLIAIPLMMLALFAMGIHSTFFGPIKYAILPQHLKSDEVLAGTGLVEAGTYIAILAGTILAGVIDVEWAALGVVLVAAIGYWTGRKVPPAPPEHEETGIDWHIVRSSITLVRGTMHIPRLYLAILSISFFWTIGAVLFIQFPPLVKNILHAASWASTIVGARPLLYDIGGFLEHKEVIPLLACLLGIAISGGMFVVPLYAFLTTTVPKDQTARTVAANNIVNSGAMVGGSLLALGLSIFGVGVVDQLLMSAAMCLVSAWLAQKLHRACD